MQFSPRARKIALTASAVVVLTGVIAAGSQLLFAHAAPAPLSALPHSTAPAISGATVTGNVESRQQLTVTLTLQPHNKAALERYAQQVTTPQSGHYHQYLSPAAFAKNFGPDPKALSQAKSFAQANGLRVTDVKSGGLFLTMQGSAQQFASAFHTRLAKYTDKQGHAFFANATDLTVPQALAGQIAGVTGLDNAAVQHKHVTAPKSDTKPNTTTAHDAVCPSGVGTNTLTPTQLATAYGFPTGASANGAGQNVALAEFDGYIPDDISVFAACYAPSANVTSLLKNRLVDLSSALPAGDGAVEAELDIEVLLGMAPGLSQIHIYEAPNSNQGLIDMMAAIANDDTDATISDSWGSCESDTGFAVAQSEEIAFLQMATQGQGVYAAAGDNGAYDCLADLGSDPYFHGRQVNVDDPSSDPYVTAVGGTSLSLNASTASYIGETVWNNSASGQNNGTGGGVSQFWGAPTWQVTAGVVANGFGPRTTPDVAADADPSTGYAEYCTGGSICAPLNGWFDIGGTSAAAPLWASLAAIANQQAQTRIGLVTPALYSAYHGTTTTPAMFNDVTTGNNTFPSAQGFAAGFSAHRGYDAVTGLGTMQAGNVVNFLKTAIRFTAPRMYMAAQGNDGRYWLSGYYLNNGNNNVVPDAATGSAWFPLGSQKFQGAPAIADNGVTTPATSASGAMLYISGVAADGSVWFGSYNPGTMQFGGWTTVAGTTCKGAAAAAYAQQKFFVSCETPTGAVVLNVYNTQTSAWGGWSTIGGGLTSPPTMATDGTNLVIYAQAPITSLDQSDWFTIYTVANGQRTVWYRFLTTCLQTPAVAYMGPAAGTYAMSCIAGDTKTMWANTFNTADSSLSGWVNLGAPKGLGFYNATAVSVDLLDSPSVLIYTGETTNNAAYVQLVTDNSFYAQITGWQQASLPGIFATNPSTDYFGV